MKYAVEYKVHDATDVTDAGDVDMPTAQPSPNSIMDPEPLRGSPVEPSEQDAACSSSSTETSVIQTMSCFRPRGRSAASRALMATATNMMRDVYVRLVHCRVFCGTDIRENMMSLDCASLDPMGVLFSAQTLLRYVLSEDLLAKHGLDLSVREVMATALLLSYKLRSESHWHTGCCISSYVMGQFMRSSELPMHSDATVRQRVEHLEMELINCTPLHRVIEETPHCAFEWTLYRHYEELKSEYQRAHVDALAEGKLEARAGLRDLESDCRRKMMLALSSGYFFYHAACLCTEHEFLEELADQADSETMGKALAHISLMAIALLKRDGAHPEPVSLMIARVAAAFVKNAADLSTQKVAGVRENAYQRAGHPCQQLVGSRALARLQSVFKPYLQY
jgi:hypothetical protein